MSDLFIKLQTLRDFLSCSFEQWKSEVWEKDLDQPYCCDGRECGCGAETVREIFTRQAAYEAEKGR